MTQELQYWKDWTQARIGLQRMGNSMATQDQLELKWAHAAARDAVQSAWDVDLAEKHLRSLGEEVIRVSTLVQSRAEYLKRPDLGRRLHPSSLEHLQRFQRNHLIVPFDLVFILSDGLSSTAVQSHALGFLGKMLCVTRDQGLRIAPIVLAPYSRVASADEIGYSLQARLSVILIGERPGLSSPDSLGAYLTYQPTPGLRDSSRNCISNIRPPHGLSYEAAQHKLSYLIQESFRRRLSGVELKDMSTKQETSRLTKPLEGAQPNDEVGAAREQGG